MNDHIEDEQDHCERCGEYGPGVRKWMFYSLLANFPDSPIARQFFCHRCVRIMRIYAIIGGILAVGAIAAIIAITIWVT